MAKQAILINTLSAATDLTGGAVDLGDNQVIAIECVFTGSNVVGTLKLQSSIGGTSWIDIVGSSQAVTASTNHMWNVTSAQYRYIRPMWTYTSGTGNLTITSFAKDTVVKGC